MLGLGRRSGGELDDWGNGRRQGRREGKKRRRMEEKREGKELPRSDAFDVMESGIERKKGGRRWEKERED